MAPWARLIAWRLEHRGQRRYRIFLGPDGYWYLASPARVIFAAEDRGDVLDRLKIELSGDAS